MMGSSDAILSRSSSIDQILAVMLRRPIVITVSSLMAVVADLPTNEQTRKLGAVAMGSAMNTKKATEPHVNIFNQLGINNNDAWKIKGSINFSMFVLLGHILLSFDEADMGKLGLKCKPAYRQSIGGKHNLLRPLRHSTRLPLFVLL